MEQARPIVEFNHVGKTYSNGKQALIDFNLKVMPGDFVCFIGTSGGGKTTAMRMINRMLDPSTGEVLFDGQNVANLDPIELRRHIGYVIQNIGLIPHMPLEENICLVSKLLKWPKEKQAQRARELIKLFEMLEDFLSLYPHEISGGQQQRIGVIRALAADQKVILMDEPFGALDPLTREKLQDLVHYLQHDMGKTIIMVTHDMDEALRLATRIVVFDQGHIIQSGSPAEIIKAPANDFVEELIGADRLNRAKVMLTTADSIMLKNPISTTADITLGDALVKMNDHHIDSLIVVDDQRHLIGELDISQVLLHRDLKLHVRDYMRTSPRSVFEDDLLSSIYPTIINCHLKYMPVVDHEQRVVGIITRSSLATLLYEQVWGKTDS
ncbi:MAG TPA: ABC transporter ATP-binding protein [Candidatus Limosilactobacillus merdipullorum]|uniref:Quaternary amine transport ATP-binding protein n=1 Tax=Candidatus Limosilactobacillus merdipullorum TaxID=2838653 RepID=A0A9D1U2X7_9LACO|nr:ABC transporter ATP-binding protein [Candidatus Limosilactobacillus merdipullorum]